MWNRWIIENKTSVYRPTVEDPCPCLPTWTWHHGARVPSSAPSGSSLPFPPSLPCVLFSTALTYVSALTNELKPFSVLYRPRLFHQLLVEWWTALARWTELPRPVNRALGCRPTVLPNLGVMISYRPGSVVSRAIWEPKKKLYEEGGGTPNHPPYPKGWGRGGGGGLRPPPPLLPNSGRTQFRTPTNFHWRFTPVVVKSTSYGWTWPKTAKNVCPQYKQVCWKQNCWLNFIGVGF